MLDGTTKDTGFLYLFIYLLLILLNMMAMMFHEKKGIINNLMLEVALQETSIPFMGEGTEYFMLQKSQIMASLMGHLVQMEIYIHTLNLCTMTSPIRHKIFRITVKPVDNSHPRDLNWPLNTGLLKYSLGMV